MKSERLPARGDGPPVAPTALRFVVLAIATFALAAVLLAGWFRVVGDNRPLPDWVPRIVAEAVQGGLGASASEPVIYYRHPDGEPSYSPVLKSTEDGRAYLPVRFGEDINFDDPPNTATVAIATGTASSESDRTILYYRNPMGLPDTSPVPKKDSMGMDYIPVYVDEFDDASAIVVSPGKVQRAGVRTELATRRSLTQPLRAPGTIQVDERRITVVATRAEAFVEEVTPVTTGDRVAKGQPLVRLYVPEIAAAAAQYLTDLGSGAKRARSGGGSQRLQNLGMPAEAIDSIETEREVPLSLTLSSPRDGVVLERNVVDGMRAMPGDVMFRLADTSVVWAMIDIAERDLPMIALGQPVTVRPRGYAERVFNGKIGLIYPQLNMATRTARVRVELANPDGVLLANMYVDADVATTTAEAAVAVPTGAVIDSGNRQVVFVDLGEGRFEARDVKLGARGEGYVEILEGIAEGDRVVSSGTFLIDAESNLKAALAGLTAPEPSP